MLKKLMHGAVALTMAAGVTAASFDPAEARSRRGAAVAGAIVGGTILGLAIAGSSRARASHCYEGPRRCEWRNRRCYENRWGEWVCRGGERVCWRERICD